MSYFEDVVRWHRAVGHPVVTDPNEVRFKGTELGAKLVREEFREMMEDGYSVGNLIETADGAADLIWVICGLCARLGINLDVVWEEVKRANFGKIGGPVRPDGKQLKPLGWKPPDILKALDVPIEKEGS